MFKYNQQSKRIDSYIESIQKRIKTNGLEHQDLIALDRCLTAKELLLNNYQERLRKKELQHDEQPQHNGNF